jgi:hypothetical protein
VCSETLKRSYQFVGEVEVRRGPVLSLSVSKGLDRQVQVQCNVQGGNVRDKVLAGAATANALSIETLRDIGMAVV